MKTIIFSAANMPLTATKPTKYHFSMALPLLRLQAGRYGQVNKMIIG
jgi:hypothetical protein